MQLAHRSIAAGRGLVSRRVSSSLPAVAKPVVQVLRQCTVAVNKRLHRSIVRAAEEAASDGEVTESSTSESNKEEEVAEPVALSPLQRARQALEDTEPDKSVVEEALGEIEAEMASMQERVAAAEARSATLEASGNTAKDQLLRLTADFDNFRRRTREEKEALRDSVRGDIVTSLLPVIDNFEMARTQVKAETEAEIKINSSYQALYKQFVEFLRSLGVEAVPGEGTLFDPMLHEAIMQEVDNGVPEGTVIAEFRKGFRLGDKLLRASMVKVSTNDGPPVLSEEE